MIKTLEYYFEDETHVKFNKYTIDICGVVRNKNSGKILSIRKIGNYNVVNVYNNDRNSRAISVGRALASTFVGPPPTTQHTVDHIDRNSTNDTLVNIRWLCKKGQSTNQDRPETYKSAFVIVRDENEKTIKEWVEHLKDEKNSFGRDYTVNMIKKYAQKKQFGFSYKEYPDLPEEVWNGIVGSKTIKGRWEISNMNRVKWITTHAENVISGERLGLDNGYPTISINGQNLLCHILVFMTFFPEEYAVKKPNENVLHENDDKLDFRPHKLRLGTQCDNAQDAYNNGCYDGVLSARQKCSSYINGIFEKEYESQRDAARYLRCVGYDKADYRNIGAVLSGHRNTAYGRTWKLSICPQE